MKNHLFTLFLVVACLQSCVLYVNDPQRPTDYTGGGKPWWNDTTGNDNNSGHTTDTIIVVVNDDTDNNNDESQISGNEEPPQNFVPTSKYDVIKENGILTFNIYLGWRVGAMETAVMIRDFPAEGGEIFFNIYTNNLYMSMYGFSKYATDFYIFSDEPPYCGYSSYSLDTQPVCKYKMIITENNTGVERFCSGYWACNNGSSFYSSFKIILYQSTK